MPAVTTEELEREDIRARVQGDYVKTTCVDCGAALTLSLLNELTGERIEPPITAMRFADMLMCDPCTEKYETEKLERFGREATAARLRASDLPKAYRELTFDEMIGDGDRKTTIDRAAGWATSHHPRGLYLYGEPGAGKTRLAATTACLRLSRWPIRWLSVAVLFATLQSSFSDDDRKQTLRALRGTDGLVLDDIDKIPLGDNSRAHLLVAISQRIENESPLLITGNLKPAQLRERFGESIGSRILGYCSAYKLDGPDRRMKLT